MTKAHPWLMCLGKLYCSDQHGAYMNAIELDAIAHDGKVLSRIATPHLDDENKVLLEKDASPFGKDLKFPGFDGNNESEYMGTASFIVNELERFEEFKGRSFNSYFPSIDGHRRMLSVFKKVRESLNFSPMSVEDLVSVHK